ncbi:MAG: response regulator [Xanthomonadales bacterium]|nr:response regulator [Xanthomonadales bacterium]
MTVPLLRSQAAILVVDDDPDILDLVEILVSEAGLQPHCHADGDSALAALDRGDCEPALALLDILMPVMDGHELADALRQRRPQLPILFVSGFSPRRVSISDEGGPTALLHKPFRPQQLLEQIRLLLEQV